MTSFTPTVRDLLAVQDAPGADTGTPRKDGPVLMADCTTPLAGETLLSLLWKRWDKES
ncbi:hypothetical protein [uncultured Marivita sp.]|uniref:hypothetical protein n=1 Tax=uncultured Marivita sp. TaxID=888080 RepID=UPI002632663E|nr:hypothetical protein [uncultured Marivita sp.]